MAEDYHGLISLPAPRVTRYEESGKQGSVNLGRMRGGASGPAALYALAMGGPSLAQGLDAVGDELYRQEIERQDLEAIKEMELFQDEERKAFEQMSQMTGEAGAGAYSTMDGFYKEFGDRLRGQAKGDHQKKIYEQFLARQRDAGMNAALNHQLKQHEVWKEQSMFGLTDRMSRDAAANPAAWRAKTDELNAMRHSLYPNEEPGQRAALDAKAGDMMVETAVLGALEQGDPGRAQEVLNDWREQSTAGGQPASLPKGAEPYVGLANEAANTYGVPANVVLAVMQTESGFRAGAVSQTGVKGLMQVTQSTYKGLGFTGDRSDPRNSTMAGTKLLGQLYQQYGNWEDAFAAYNGGPDAVRGLRTGNWGVWAGNAAKQREIRNYAPTVMRNLQAMGTAANQEAAPAAQPTKPVMLASLGPEIAASASDAYGVAPANDDEFVADPLSTGSGNPQLDAKLQGMIATAKAGALKAAIKDTAGNLEKKALDGTITMADVDAAMGSGFLSRSDGEYYLKVVAGEAGYLAEKQQLVRQQNERVIKAGLEFGHIRPTRKGIVQFINDKGWGPFFRPEDVRGLVEFAEKETGKINKTIDNYVALNKGSFGRNTNEQADNIAIFKIKALDTALELGMTAADEDGLGSLLGTLAENKKYLEDNPALFLGQEFSEGRPEIRDRLVQYLLNNAGLPQTSSNVWRANEAIKLSRPLNQIMPANAANWSGRGALTLKDNSGRIEAYSDDFEDASKTYGIDPDFIAAVSMAAAGAAGNRAAAGLMGLPAELAGNMKNPLDARDNIFEGARFLGNLLTHYGGDPEAAAMAYAASQGSPAPAEFARRVLALMAGQTPWQQNSAVDSVMEGGKDMAVSLWEGFGPSATERNRAAYKKDQERIRKDSGDKIHFIKPLINWDED